MIYNIYLRVDGNAQMGLGHLIRSLALAHMLRDNFNIAFFCRDIPIEITVEILKSNFKFYSIEDENEFLTMLKSSDIVILDGYHFNLEYQTLIKNKGVLLIAIEDHKEKASLADLIINHAPGVFASDYTAEPNSSFALGPEYALLRPEFLEAAKQTRIGQNINSVFICFGGSDYLNLTHSVVKLLVLEVRFKRILVVTGPAYQHLVALSNFAGLDSRIELYHSVTSRTMLSLLLQSDLAIVPASGILYEVFAAGCVAISGTYIDNQTHLYNECLKRDWIIGVADFNRTSLLKAIALSFDLKPQMNKYIDGFSGKRISRLITRLYFERKMSIRGIRFDDVNVTYEWAINKEIRKFSFEQKRISRFEHLKWFEGKLSSKGCFFYMGELDDQPIGCVRFDLSGDTALISYLLDPIFQGRGIGKVILSKAMLNLIKDAMSPLRSFVGYVDNRNIPSIRIFKALGFTMHCENDRFKFEKQIVYDSFEN